MTARLLLSQLRRGAELALLAGGLTGVAGVFLLLPDGEPLTVSAGIPPAELAGADQELADAFPNFRFIHAGHYRLVTDAPDSVAHHTLDLLATLREQFEHHFAALIRPDVSLRPIQVIYFTRETDYRAYVMRVAPGLLNSAGLFAPLENRLALLDQFGTADYRHAQATFTAQEQRLAALVPPDALAASVRLAEMRSEVVSEARAHTTRLTRHEGAHQLFHAYGIESAFPVAPTWLTEGLAQYCEADEIGAPDELLIRRLKKARTLLPLRELINHRQPAGFFTLGAGRVEVAYAQSWALTYFLMQPERQAGFFEFIKHYRDVPEQRAAQVVRNAEVAGTLCRFLEMDFATLEARWQEFLGSL